MKNKELKRNTISPQASSDESKSESSIENVNVDYDFRESFDNLRTPDYLAREVQTSANDIVRNCTDFEWSEDHISFQIVVAIRNILGKYAIPNVENTTNLSSFDLEAYKITGKAERAHGDIVFVITRMMAERRDPLTGVGFYEAKASSIWGGEYPSFNKQQLRRLVTHTPKLSYLIYSREARSSNNLDWPAYVEENRSDSDYVQTIDANLLKDLRSISLAVRLGCLSFGHHFVYRILSGRDLDYSRKPIDTIRRWIKLTKRTDALVVSITVKDSGGPFAKHPNMIGFDQVDMPALPGRQKRKLPNID